MYSTLLAVGKNGKFSAMSTQLMLFGNGELANGKTNENERRRNAAVAMDFSSVKLRKVHLIDLEECCGDVCLFAIY